MCDEIYIKSIACEDIETTISLPNVLPEIQKCKTFEESENIKQLAQTDLIDKMLLEIKNINLPIDVELEQMNTCTMEELKIITKELDTEEREEYVSLEEAKILLRQNKNINTQLTTLVDEFDQDLKLLEKHRSDLIQETVSSYLFQINKTRTEHGQARFNDIVLHLNRNMLQNMQRNEDLKLKLEIEGQERLKKYQEKLKAWVSLAADKHAKHLWSLLKIKQNKRMMLDAVFSLSEENSKTRESFLQISNSLISNLNEFVDVLELPGDTDQNEDLWKQWIDTLNKKLEMLSVLSKNVEGLMKTALFTLLESFDEKVNLLNRTTTPLTDSRQPETDKQSITMSSEIDELKAKQEEELKHLQNTWHTIITALNKKIEDTKHCIFDLTSLLKNHLLRVNEFEKDIEKTLDTAKKQCEKQDKDKSAKLKSHIKSLREAKDLEKLNGQYTTLEKCFDDISELWIEHLESSLKMIDDKKEKEIGRLIEEKKIELVNFLQIKYPKRDILSKRFSPKLSSSGTEFETQIDMCNTYMTAVDYRTLGLYEMLERYLPMSEEVIRQEINDSLEMKKIDTFNEYQNHISMIQELRTKTLQETKQIRYAELKVHSERLTSHSSAVKLVLEDINKEYNDTKLNQQRKLDDFSEKLKTVANNSSLQSSWKLKNAIHDLELEWSNLSELLLNDITNAKTRSENKFTMLQNSNNMFLKIPKHFNKGGNYSPEEIKILNRELKQLEKLFKSQQKSVMNNFTNLAKGVSQSILDDKTSGIKNQLVARKMEENITDTLNIVRQRLTLEVKTIEASERALGLSINQLATIQVLDQQKINRIYENASTLCDNLRLPPSVANLECARRMSTYSEPSGSKKSHKKYGKDIDYTLFINTNENIKSEGNNFISRTKELIFNKYNFLVKLIEDAAKITKTEGENKSKSTGTKKNKEHEKGRLADVITVQIEEIKRTLLNYNIECELFWLEKVQSVLQYVNSFQSITTALVNNKLHCESGDYLDCLRRLENGYIKTVQIHLEQGMNERSKTQKSLVLPLAHPTHYEKLEGLYEKVKHVAHDHKSILKKELIAFKDRLQKYHKTYADKLKTLKDILIETQSCIHNWEVFEMLIKDLITVKENLPTESHAESEFDRDGKAVTEELRKEKKAPGHENNYEIEIPNYPQSIWSNEECSSEKVKNVPPGYTLEKESNISSDVDLSANPVPININKVATNNLKESTEQITTILNEANNNFNQNCRIIDEWVEHFERNMKLAKNIFTAVCD